MLIAAKRMPAGAGLAPVLLRRAAHVTLDWDARQKSRFDTVDSTGRALGVVLPRGVVLRGGDVLVAEDGSLVRVEAKAQTVARVTVPSGRDPLDLARAAYHLGNRHVPLEVRPTHLQLEPDHVLAEMLVRMGFAVETVEAPFEPEGGAYDAGSAGAAHAHGGAHDHSHGPAHNHNHGHGASHGHEHGPAPAHDHAASHGDDHGPSHGHAHGPAPAAAQGPAGAHPNVHCPGCGHDHG